MLYYLKPKSSNEKTGPIPVSTSSASTCPDSCPFKRNGCYADGGPLRMHWDKVTRGRRGQHWENFLAAVREIPTGQLWRHNQAGDLPGRGDTIDGPKLRQLTQANKGKRGFTYTHKPPRGNNLRAIKRANREGFTVNLSANSIAHADFLSALGAPVVTVLPAEWEHKVYRTLGGNRIVTCPATYNPNVTCGGGKVRGSDGITRDTIACGLCAIRDRSSIVGFPAHGASKRKASDIAEGGA